MICFVEGEWILEIDYSGGIDFILEGSVIDLIYLIGSFFGWVCIYMSICVELFFMDDVLVDLFFIDIVFFIFLEVILNIVF